MNIFERYLSIWVACCIIVGVTLGHFFPDVFQQIGAMEVARVNLPVAVLIWLMIIPMLVKIDFSALGEVKEHWRGIGVTLFINWAIKPFSMAALAWLFIGKDIADEEPRERCLSQWQRSRGSSSAMSLRRTCLQIKSTPTSRD